MSDRCDGCYKRITEGTTVSAMRKRFHKNCFVCAHCKLPFADGKFLIHKDQPYCQLDYDHICAKCSKVIGDMMVTLGEKKYHSACFKCTLCGKALAGKEYFTFNNSPYCKDDYELEKRLAEPSKSSSSASSASASSSGSRSPAASRSSSSASSSSSSSSSSNCLACRKPIEDRAMVVEGKRWHKDCFKCSKCRNKILAGESFNEDDDEPNAYVCATCSAPKCKQCNRAIDASSDVVNFEGTKYHPRCFKCVDCRTVLDPSAFYAWEKKPYCKDDYLIVKKKAQK
eukprot:TRINITY_DN10314_c0_g1_i1.p1 TRINITY_DN10314_c0_g1~~TRINITY_DN10314_c0_g1_i1.p1  ORF type:complete len:284 (+),score=57.32 TRINITY_DN10314_c0_g1_i1:68-919(+)